MMNKTRLKTKNERQMRRDEKERERKERRRNKETRNFFMSGIS
jgi:hypothetical protein